MSEPSLRSVQERLVEAERLLLHARDELSTLYCVLARGDLVIGEQFASQQPNLACPRIDRFFKS